MRNAIPVVLLLFLEWLLGASGPTDKIFLSVNPQHAFFDQNFSTSRTVYLWRCQFASLFLSHTFIRVAILRGVPHAFSTQCLMCPLRVVVVVNWTIIMQRRISCETNGRNNKKGGRCVIVCVQSTFRSLKALWGKNWAAKYASHFVPLH